MYKTSANNYVYSPSDLTLYMRSPFASWMERYDKEQSDKDWLNKLNLQKSTDPMIRLLAGQGNKHEQTFLDILKLRYGVDQVAIIDTTDKVQAAQQTENGMLKGAAVIYQAYLSCDNFAGFADFLVKREGKSRFGDYYYEAWDTKFSKSTQAYFVVQLCCYSWMLEAIQGTLPDEIVIVLGSQKEQRLRIAAYYSYFISLKQRFLQDQALFTGKAEEMPDPALCSDYGVWGDYAKHLLANSDSLALVANIRKSQIKRLKQVGITTLTGLANTEEAGISGMANDSFNKLKAQASAQLKSRGQVTPYFEVQKNLHNKGLEALPPKSEKDVFFDIEGYPLLDGGLEYLWGVSYYDEHAPKGNQYAFKDWWAHDQDQEKQAVEGFIDWVYARWQNDQSLHVYHYASYEITALLKLTSRYQTRLDQLTE